jgi:leucyl-tRNA synthetase
MTVARLVCDKQRGVTVNSGVFSGLSVQGRGGCRGRALQAKGLGEKKTTWRLRDWGVSRQRYWGTPIPIIHCAEHGAVPVPEKDLPVVLPQDCVPDGSGNPLHKHEGFHAGVWSARCAASPRGAKPTPWTPLWTVLVLHALLRPDQRPRPWWPGTDYWMRPSKATGCSGMDQYIGGIEHAILHLLYARFWTKVMRDMGLVKVDEPFTKLLTQGMVLNHIYSRKGEKGRQGVFLAHRCGACADDSGKVIGPN